MSINRNPKLSTTSQCIGHTPIVAISTPSSSARVLVKLEGLNPGGSIKDRVAQHIIQKAEQEGKLNPQNKSQTIIECSGGSMAHGLLTAVGNKYSCLFVVPDNYSETKITLLKARGAEVILADSTQGNDAHFKLASIIAAYRPDYFFANQLQNLDNPETHYLYTGPEIVEQLRGETIDYFITGIGSGGTISGIGARLRERYPKIQIIGVQPIGCDVVKGEAIRHRIQGWGVGMKTNTLQTDLLDAVVDVGYDDAIAQCDRMNTQQGLFLGISSGANIYAAQRLAALVGPTKTILTISPDGGVYYAENYVEYRSIVHVKEPKDMGQHRAQTEEVRP